ncbi:hypothetical protein Pmani_022724 [Petrolisthes manimaculis]|uniref:EGF-like domain-containing protein n=1 Tax=Petrolisthes manimaculis TaxID=1843537 RepID=A0AAE1PDS4_9EUCA|nr:hypothetical protein Pmani_022724 [Petrolisthes manimaculis]
MVRLRVRCRCITVALIILHIFLGIWYFSQPLDSHHHFLQRGESPSGQKILHLRDQPHTVHFVTSGKELCVREGTNEEASSGGKCVCIPGWKGRRCGVPEVLQRVGWMHVPGVIKNLQLRRRAKRLIMISPFTLEFDIFETNVLGLSDLVDVFVVGEVNHTTTTFNPSFGTDNASTSNITDPHITPDIGSTNHTISSLPLLSRLQGGWLREHQHKIVYVPVLESDFKGGGSFLQTLVYFALRLVSDLRPDDLLLLTTGEEILRRDVTVFLKLFHGYPMPVRCRYKQHLYGFFWQVEEGMEKNMTDGKENLDKEQMNNATINQPNICAVSIHFFSNAFEYQVSKLHNGKVPKESLAFLSTADEPYLDWTIEKAGWRCHICLSVQRIFHKFLNTPLDQQPKWFSESPSSMLPFIQRLIKFGQNENLEKVGTARLPSQETVPPYIWQNKKNFAHLTKNPYETISIQNLV